LKSRELFLIWILISLIEIYCQLYWKDADEKETAMVQDMWRAEQATIYIPIGIGLGPGEYIVHQTANKGKEKKMELNKEVLCLETYNKYLHSPEPTSKHVH
jgi:hypothetical protein